MVKQEMARLFNKGGMTDDGATRDPVSGNPVPPGSMAGEVRDDQTIRVSGGEYIVPANVVQFYGVDKFEKMVNKAEEGLGEMEANGRIGGEQAPDTAVEEELPFSDEELMSIEGEPTAYAEGGVIPDTASTGGVSGVENKVYTNQSGDKRTILFFNGMPVQAIPEGYFPDTGENKELVSEDPSAGLTELMAAKGADDEDRGIINKHERDPAKSDPTQWETEDFGKYLDQQTTVEMLSKGIGMAGPGGALIGGLMAKSNKHVGNKALEEINRRLEDDSTSESAREQLMGLRDQYQGLSDERSGGGLLGGGGGGLLGGLAGGGGVLGFFKDMFSGGSSKPSEVSSTPSRPLGIRQSRRDDPIGGSTSSRSPASQNYTNKQRSANPTRSAPTSTPKPKSRPSAPKKTYNYEPKVSKKVRDDIKKSGGYSGGGPNGGFAKGGFVKKRNK